MSRPLDPISQKTLKVMAVRQTFTNEPFPLGFCGVPSSGANAEFLCFLESVQIFGRPMSLSKSQIATLELADSGRIRRKRTRESGNEKPPGGGPGGFRMQGREPLSLDPASRARIVPRCAWVEGTINPAVGGSLRALREAPIAWVRSGSKGTRL